MTVGNYRTTKYNSGVTTTQRQPNTLVDGE